MKVSNKILLVILLLLVLNTSFVYANEGISNIEIIQQEVDNYETITLNQLASIISDNLEVTYENFEYYRKDIRDTSNRSILHLYSEGLLLGDGLGNIKADRVLTEQEVSDIISRLEDRKPPSRPEYSKINNIPILMYHEINTLPKNGPTGLYVSQENFSKQLDSLIANGYNTVTMEQVYKHWENKSPLPEKPVVLTFDDGYLSHYTFASKELAKRGMVGTFYIITDNIRDDGSTTSEMLRTMYSEGMEIGSHTVTHIDARYSKNEKILKEYTQSKEFLEKILGVNIEHFCYPIGGNTKYAIQTLQDLGYKTAVKTSYGKANEAQGLLTLNRIRVDYRDSTTGFLNKVK